MDVCVTCSLNFETVAIDYHIELTLTFFMEINLPLNDNNTVYDCGNPNCNTAPHFPILNPHTSLNMNILAWNVRGAGGTNFKRVFCDMVATHRADVVILIETRVSDNRALNIITSLGFENYMKVDAMEIFEKDLASLETPNNLHKTHCNLIPGNTQQSEGKKLNFSYHLYLCKPYV